MTMNVYLGNEKFIGNTNKKETFIGDANCMSDADCTWNITQPRGKRKSQTEIGKLPSANVSKSKSKSYIGNSTLSVADTRCGVIS